jgi:DNA helicase-2/ATP-dependent DNA helicase PcrA
VRYIKKEIYNKYTDDMLNSVITEDDDYSSHSVPYDVSLDDYQHPEMAGYIHQEIKDLQKIAHSIEKKIVPCPEKDLPSHFKIDYKSSLNNMQIAAVTLTEGPVLVIAGAGSGKTRTIVYRVAYLIENNISPQNILLLTFTKKAAQEMISRTMELLNDVSVGKVTGGTFHSFANMLLRKYAKIIGIPSNYTIIDTVDGEDVIDLIRRESNFNKRDSAFPRKGRIYEAISKSRNCNKAIEDVIYDGEELDYLKDFLTEINVIAKKYKEYKKLHNIYDYDDLMEVLRDSLKTNPVFLEKVQDDYKYIMVDEYQDTNIIQKEIVDLIAKKHRNVMVVGDDAQSIYAFRGANFENILRLHETYPDCKVVKLEENYRSNQAILNFTNSIIENALLGYKKRLFSNNLQNKKPLIKRFYSQAEEAEFVVLKIEELIEKGILMHEIAVLYRAGFHGYFIEAELMRRGISYVVYGGIKFMERRHIKDMIAYLRIVENPLDPVAWNRNLKLIPGIGNVLASSIVKTIKENNGNIDFSVFKSKKCYSSLKELGEVLKEVSVPDLSIPEKIEILKEYYFPILKTVEDDYVSRIKDINILSSLAVKYDDLEKYLADLMLEPPSNKFKNESSPVIEELNEKPLVLSTVHSAKGLEWHTVFIPHLLDGLFPSLKALKGIKQIEEERRLFYVACTRAKENLFLTMPYSVTSYEGYLTKASRFLVEIDKENYEL